MNDLRLVPTLGILALVLFCCVPSVAAQEMTDEELAKAPQNPIASMISVPIRPRMCERWVT